MDIKEEEASQLARLVLLLRGAAIAAAMTCGHGTPAASAPQSRPTAKALQEEALDWGCIIVLCYLQFLQLSRQPHVQGPGRQIALWVMVLAYACLTTQLQPLEPV